MSKIRNVAIIAHVDHGKTTLIDQMLKQSGQFRDSELEQERIMDTNDLEKERGITILAKCTSIEYQGYKLNIVDTPGHADFGGEVERILSMVDAVVLLVDAVEGVMPQTKFVLSKSLAMKKKPILVVNKIDKPANRVDEVVDEVLELFMSFDVQDDELDFPILYAAGRDGWVIDNMDKPKENLKPLFDKIINYVPEPEIINEDKFRFLVSIIKSDNFLGRILIGKVHSGSLRINDNVKVLDTQSKLIETARVTKLFSFRATKHVPVNQVHAGDLVAIAGLKNATVSHSIVDTEIEDALQANPIDPPTISVSISVNNSPFAGKDGNKVTSTVIRERLMQEAEGNVAITLDESDGKDAFEIGGRGELQIGVFIESMRREGFELSVSRPKVLFKIDENGKKLEPIEEVVVDVDEEYSGIVVEKLAKRKGKMIEMITTNSGKVRLRFMIPSRGLIGFHGEFLTDTKGTGILNRLFAEYQEYKGNIESYRNGALISGSTGNAVAYALFNLQDRGEFFVTHNDKVYQGMIIGLHNKNNDLEVNPCKSKQLTNMRASGKDDAIKLSPPKILTLEQAIAFINDDELVEVTPNFIRLRKKFLDPIERKRQKNNS